jgi:cellulose synthase (UDP-forming)
MLKNVKILPGIKELFGLSLLTAAGVLFWDRWTSSGPTLFDDFSVNPVVSRSVPSWLGFPQDEWVLMPIAIVMVLGFLLRFIPASNLSRAVVKPLVVFLALRYLAWRTSSSLNLSHPASITFTIILYAAEVFCLLSFILHTAQTIFSTDRQRKKEADRYQKDILSGDYLPTVDVFIPSYNEPDYIVSRTVMGCQAMTYPNKRIYILDDTRRENIRALAKELGCEYITRPDNAHAKAGNLNHALPKTDGEFIALMDADFVPFHNFLTRTVGFFQDKTISLVQTPQNFYNPDFHARNMGLGDFLPNDLENFFGSIQPHRDSVNSVICCGSCYVVRRSSIEAVGGYYTQCCVEDYQTSLKMLLAGQRIVYLNETLSMGESTRMCADFVDQRLRWLQGNFQVYYCKDLGLWSNKLSWGQRSFLFEQWLHCFSSVIRLIFLLCPLVSLYTGIAPYLTNINEIVYFFLPFWILSAIVQGWSTDYRSSYFWVEVYGLIFCFPSVMRMAKVVFKPFGKVSKVTRKGVKADGRSFNWGLISPLIMILIANLLGLALKLGGAALGWWHLLPVDQLAPMVFWISYNSALLVVAILASIDQPVRRLIDRFPLQVNCELGGLEGSIAGVSSNISEGGSEIFVRQQDWQTQDWQSLETVTLKFEKMSLQGRVIRSKSQGKLQRVSIGFESVTEAQKRQLVEWLYCEVHDFKARRQPGGLDSMLAMGVAVLQMRSVTRIYQ